MAPVETALKIFGERFPCTKQRLDASLPGETGARSRKYAEFAENCTLTGPCVKF